MTAATASITLPAECSSEPFRFVKGHLTPARDFAPTIVLGKIPAMAAPPENTPSMMAPSVAQDNAVSSFAQAGPSDTRSLRTSGSEDDATAPLSPVSDTTVASPVVSTPRAASSSFGTNTPVSPKGKARASEEELAGIDPASLSDRQDQPTLPASATSAALEEQAAVSQHLTQPLLQVLDEAQQDRLEVEQLLGLEKPPDPPGNIRLVGTSEMLSDAAVRAAVDMQGLVGDSAPEHQTVSQMITEPSCDADRRRASTTSSSSDGDFQDATESPASESTVATPAREDVIAWPPPESPAGSLAAVATSEGVHEAAAAFAETAVEDDGNRPVSTAQPDISRTPSTSTTGSSHAGSVDTAVSSTQSTAASSCPDCPEHSCDTLKVAVDGEPNDEVAHTSSPVSSTSETGRAPPKLLESPIPEAHQASDAAGPVSEAEAHEKLVQGKLRRYAALMELVETERNYADDLGTLVLVFFDNLGAMPYFEDHPARHALVTRNSEDLLRLHQRLSARLDGIMSELGLRKGGSSPPPTGSAPPDLAGRTELEKALSPQADEAVIRVAKLFSSMMPALHGYQAFCSRHGEALTLVREAEKRHADWDAFERRCSEILRLSRGSSRPPSNASTPGLAGPSSSPVSYFTPILPVTQSGPSSMSGSTMANSGGSSSGTASAAATPGSVHSAIRQNSSRLLFRDFLIKPIQRLCLYPLVLQTLLKHTEADSAGAAELTKLVAMMRDVADQVDEAGRRREQELMADLITSRVEVHHGVTPGFLRSLGECRLAGTLDVLHHHRTLDPLVAPLRFKYFGVFLYDGFILLVKVKKGPSYECRQWFPLWAARLSNVEEGSSLLPHSLRLSVRQHHFELAASNARERRVWINALSSAISNATVAPPGTESSFPSSLFLGGGGDGYDSDGDANSPGATPSASRGADATSYWDMPRDSVADPLMEFFAQHATASAAVAPVTAAPTPSAATCGKGQKAATTPASLIAGMPLPSGPGDASATVSRASKAASTVSACAEQTAWIPAEILLRHASPSSRSIVDRGMVFSDAVLNARTSKDGGDLSTLWLPHNQTLGSAVGTAMGLGRLSAKEFSTVKIQRRKSCIASLENPDVAVGQDGAMVFTATVVNPNATKSRPSAARSMADFSVAIDAGGAGSNWKASLRKKANKVRPPSIFAPSGLTIMTDDLTSPRSPRSAKSTPTSPVQATRDIQPIDFTLSAGAGSSDFLHPGGPAARLRQGSDDLTPSSLNSSPRPGYGVSSGSHSGFNSAASSFANLRAAAADGRRKSSIYGVKDTLTASIGGRRRSRTRSGQTDLTDMSGEAFPSSRGVSPMSSVTALNHGAVIDETERPPLDGLSAIANPTREQTGRLWSGSRTEPSKQGTLRRALTSASFSGRKRTQSDVGMLIGVDGQPCAAPAVSAKVTSNGRITANRLERSDSNVTMPADARRDSAGSLSLRRSFGKRFGGGSSSNSAASGFEPKPAGVGGSLRRSRTMLITGRSWFGSLASTASSAAVDRSVATADTAPSATNAMPSGSIRTKSSPSLAATSALGTAGSTPDANLDPASSGVFRSSSSRPLSQCRSFTDPELASQLAGCPIVAPRVREVARSESAPTVPVISKAGTDSPSPKRGSRMLNTLRFLQTNRLSPMPLKAVAETSVEHSAGAAGGDAGGRPTSPLPQPGSALSSLRRASHVKGRTSMPSRFSIVDGERGRSTSGSK